MKHFYCYYLELGNKPLEGVLTARFCININFASIFINPSRNVRTIFS